ncbi:MAG: glycosyltransferase family 2 protein [Lachnospiraceae bacterium]|mgnify:FL=1|nr:glycosyltransferase family 2 protein [Lachnospiraceae bacterium]
MQINSDIEVVITSFNQKSMIYEAVHSLCCQTIRPKRMIIVDDGSTDETSIDILHEIETDEKLSIPVRIIRQKNSGVSAARNTGISETESLLVVVLDGDDSLEPSYIEEVSKMLHENPSMVAASSWLQTFGILEAVVRPEGGDVSSFLARNCCPATHMFRREAWKQCGGYDETMRSGFEDWDFFLSMLEALPDTYIGIVEKPLINYRTTPASSNIKSMEKRLELMRYIVEKHGDAYQEHVVDAILGMESISMSRLYGWENEINYAQLHGRSVSNETKTFIESPSYGDGGMAAAVRIVSMENQM